MDVVVQYKDTDMLSQIEPTIQAFYPLLEQHATNIQRIRIKTLQYGATDRHNLDVYYPPSTPSGKVPVLYFVYGGGYLSGDKQFAAPHSLLYKNVGAYLTVIADYRLLPNMKFPDPVVDIKDAIVFIVDHAAKVNEDSTVHADIDDIFLMGHSAGGAILATLLLLPDLTSPEITRRIRGVILQAGMYHLNTKVVDVPPQVAPAYYGSTDEIRANTPLGLLRHASDKIVSGLPDIVTTISEYEAPGLLEAHQDFLEALKARTGKDTGAIVLRGHNHISAHVALSAGVGEEWVNECDMWMKARVTA